MQQSSQNNFTAELLSAVESVDRPGVFCASGVADPVPPGLEVRGVGLIGLPLLAEQAKLLKGVCEQAPYGKGAQTVVDTKVRRVWRLSPNEFTLTNPAWNAALREIVTRVQNELGLEGRQLEPHLYNLLLYEEGSFFLPHRDGEKLDGMVATLVVALPCIYTGGELIVRHENAQRVVDFAGADAKFQIQYAAFYADCEHEVKPLTSGHRLCLIYNLVLAKPRQPVGAPRHQQHVAQLTAALKQWPVGAAALQKLALPLEHQYTQDGLTWTNLKGVDAARARVLAEAARQAGCHVHLALLEFFEISGVDEDDGYGRRSSRSPAADGAEHEGRQYTIIEVYETSLTADHWQSPEGESPQFGPLAVDTTEIFPDDWMKTVKPQQDVEGDTGNEGLTLERRYRRAAIVLWPDAHHLEILCSGGAKQAVAALSAMAARARAANGDDAVEARERCRLFAQRILAQWPTKADSSYISWTAAPYSTPPEPLDALEFINDAALVRMYLSETLKKDASLEPGSALTNILSKNGWHAFHRELTALFDSANAHAFGRNVRLLRRLCKAAGALPSGAEATAAQHLCHALAEQTVAALTQLDAPAQPRSPHTSDRNAILGPLVVALLAVDADDPLTHLVEHLAANEQLYALQETIIPAIKQAAQWLETTHGHCLKSWNRWLQHCVSQLEALTAAMPEPPADLRRDANVKCPCADCRDLNTFLANPAERQHNFQMAEARRRHLESEIKRNQCDLDFVTDRKPRPLILVCTKNNATYNRLLKEFHDNQNHLTFLRTLLAG